MDALFTCYKLFTLLQIECRERGPFVPRVAYMSASKRIQVTLAPFHTLHLNYVLRNDVVFGAACHRSDLAPESGGGWPGLLLQLCI